MFSKMEGCSTVYSYLKNKGQCLRYCKLSDQFNNAHVTNQDEIVKTDSLIAQGARSTKVKSALPETDQDKCKKSAVKKMDQSLKFLNSLNDTFSRDESTKYEEGSSKYNAPADVSHELKQSTGNVPSTMKSAASESSKYQHSKTGSRSLRLSERRRLESRANFLEQESRMVIEKKERELELKWKQRQLEMEMQAETEFTRTYGVRVTGSDDNKDAGN